MGATTTSDSASTARIVAFGVTFTLGLASVLVWGRTPDPYITTNLAVTYELGLVPRGLWGTALDAVGLMPRSPTAAAFLAHAFAVTGIAIFVAHTVASPEPWARHRAVVAAGVLVSPAGLPYLAAEMGRLDIVLMLLTLVAVALTRNTAPARASLLAAVTVATAVLVHEAALLVTMPIVTVVVASREGYRRALWPFMAGLATAATLLVLPMPVEQPEFYAWLASRIDRVDPLASLLPYQSLPVAVSRAWRHLTGPGPAQLAPTLLAVAPGAWLTARALRTTRAGTSRSRAFVLAALAPVALMFVGTDLPRWFALATLGLAGVAVTADPPERAVGATDLALVAVAAAATVLLGPLSV